MNREIGKITDRGFVDLYAWIIFWIIITVKVRDSHNQTFSGPEILAVKLILMNVKLLEFGDFIFDAISKINVSFHNNVKTVQFM